MASADDGQSSWTTTATNISDYDVLPLQRSVTAPGFLEKTSSPESSTSLNIRFGSSLNRNDLILETSSGSSYTSLKDVQWPQSSVCCSVVLPDDIPIRNRLIQQAAFAYLQPRLSSDHKKERWSWFDRGLRTDDDNDFDSITSSIPCVSFLCFICSGLCSAVKRVWTREPSDGQTYHSD